MTAYRILDEPTPGAAARLAVSPLWPVLALLFAGAWLAWPWLALNAFALGSPTRARELALCVLALAASLVLARFGLGAGWQPSLVAVVLLAVQLPLAWVLYRQQRRSARVFALGGMTLTSGFWVVLLGALARVPLLHHLEALWAVVLA